MLPATADNIPKGRFDSGSMAEVWGDGMAVRFRLMCADKVHSANIGMTKARSHGKGCVIKAKIPSKRLAF